jgi:hypothetical protein
MVAQGMRRLVINHALRSSERIAGMFLYVRKLTNAGEYMPSSEYHRKQADTLTILANSTRDRSTMLQLLKKAKDHLALAEEAKELRGCSERSAPGAVQIAE